MLILNIELIAGKRQKHADGSKCKDCNIAFVIEQTRVSIAEGE